MSKKRARNAIKEHARLMTTTYSDSKHNHFFNCLDKRDYINHIESLPAWVLCNDDYPIEDDDNNIIGWVRVNYEQRRPDGSFVEYSV